MSNMHTKYKCVTTENSKFNVNTKGPMKTAFQEMEILFEGATTTKIFISEAKFKYGNDTMNQ